LGFAVLIALAVAGVIIVSFLPKTGGKAQVHEKDDEIPKNGDSVRH